MHWQAFLTAGSVDCSLASSQRNHKFMKTPVVDQPDPGGALSQQYPIQPSGAPRDKPFGFSTFISARAKRRRSLISVKYPPTALV